MAEISKAGLKAKREVIRRAYRELDQPATVVELCEQYLKLDALDGVIWAWAGDSLREIGRNDEARLALQTARGLVETDEKRAFVLQCQGDLALAEGAYAEAERLYREGLALHSAHQSLWLDLGRVIFDVGRIEEAEEIFRKAVKLDGVFTGACLYEVGRCLRARGEYFEARRILKQAVKLVPDDERPGLALADVERVIRVASKTKNGGAT